MRIEKSFFSSFSFQEPDLKKIPLQLTISSLENPEAHWSLPLKIKVIFEDSIGFLRNFFLWPILGKEILAEQILLILILPILLPFMIINEILHLFIRICTCGCVNGNPLETRFSPREPNYPQRKKLEKYVYAFGCTKIPKEDQIRLLHLINTYRKFVLSFEPPSPKGEGFLFQRSLH